MADFLIEIKWNDTPKKMYFQGGPSFKLFERQGQSTMILGKFSNGDVAAMVVPFGSGFVGELLLTVLSLLQ